MFYKHLINLLYKNHSKIPKVLNLNFKLLKYSSLSNLIKFNEEESNKILDIVNKITSEELINCDISKVRAKKIYAHRLKYGEFKNLEDILEIDGFGIKILEKFGKSILNESYEKPKKDLITKQFNKFTIPLVNDELRKNIKSCVSLHIGMSSVTWSRIELNPNNEPCILTHWQHTDILYKKLHINDLIQRCLYLDYDIPNADCYIFENPQIAQSSTPGNNAEQININIQKSQLIAILGFGLAKRNLTNNVKDIEDNTKCNNIFFMKRFIPARLFNTLVGTERVSTEENILELMRTHYNFDDDNNNIDKSNKNNDEKDETLIQIKGNITISMDLRQMFKTSEGYQREFLGQSLLLGLTFIRLAILKCPYSIGKISTKSNL